LWRVTGNHARPLIGDVHMSLVVRRLRRLSIVALLSLTPAIAFAGPAEDVGSVINQWATAFNANDVDSLVDLYAPDAILVGTAGSSLFEGRDAVHNYFAKLANSGDTVSVDTSKVIVLHDEVAYVTGFYTFGGVRHGRPSTTKAGFSMVLVKRGSKWLIAHHHSSRRSAPSSPAAPVRRG
jgi:uncharacterized protein (TIGR02246 family)